MLKLETKKREVFGKDAKSLLQQGLVPAEVYGHGFENIHISVPLKEFVKVFREAGESSLLTLVSDGQEFPVLIHEVQHDVLGDQIVHIDFYRVRMDQKIRTEVPIIFIGESPAVKEKGGVFVKSADVIEVEALPADLPHELQADISSLAEIHQSLHIKDIKVPSGVKVLSEPEMTIATVTEQMKEEVAPAPVPAEGEAPAAAEGEAAATAQPSPENPQK